MDLENKGGRIWSLKYGCNIGGILCSKIEDNEWIMQSVKFLRQCVIHGSKTGSRSFDK